MRGHGDWGRDGIMSVAVRFLRYRLVEVVRLIKGLRYATEVHGIKRFAAAEATDPERQRILSRRMVSSNHSSPPRVTFASSQIAANERTPCIPMLLVGRACPSPPPTGCKTSCSGGAPGRMRPTCITGNIGMHRSERRRQERALLGIAFALSLRLPHNLVLNSRKELGKAPSAREFK